MNAVILTSILGGKFRNVRLHPHALCACQAGYAPKIFARLTTSGVPRNALLAVVLVATLCFLTSIFEDQRVYLWLLNLSGMGGFILWLGIAVAHYRFRRGFVLQGGDVENLPYRSPLFPWGPLFAFAVCLTVTLGQNYQAFLGGSIDWHGIAATYIGIPVFLALWLGYRWTHRTHFVRYEEMQFPQSMLKDKSAQK